MEPVFNPQLSNGDPALAPIAVVDQQERPLPASFYHLLSQLTPDLEGAERIREMATMVNDLPQNDRDAMRALYKKLARRMVKLNASDMDMGGPACKGHIWYRVDGDKKPYPDMGRFTMNETDVLLLNMLSPYQQDHLIENYAVDFGYTLQAPDDEAEGVRLDFGYSMDVDDEKAPPRRYRTTMYFDNQRLALCMRMLAGKPRSLRSLRFHPIIERGLMFRFVRDGLTLITGVTGSGKSTTLDAIVDANNKDFDGHILIIAQPIEFIHTSKKCIIRHREVGADVPDFVRGLVQGLRQDPDIVMIGEMRDAETISTALETADTGHKVFSTLHTASAIESIDRIVAEYPPSEQSRVRHRLGDVLRCIISQKLLPGAGGGRVLAKEVLWLTPSARAAIKNGNVNEIYQMIWEGREQGMVTLEQDLFRLVQTGEITPNTALSYANNKRRLLQLMR